MEIIDKEDNKKWMKFYEAIHETYFKWVTLFSYVLLENFKKNPNAPQNIIYEIKNKNNFYWNKFVFACYHDPA